MVVGRSSLRGTNLMAPLLRYSFLCCYSFVVVIVIRYSLFYYSYYYLLYSASFARTRARWFAGWHVCIVRVRAKRTEGGQRNQQRRRQAM